MLVAQGNYSLWASNERWQCRWGNYSNDNDPALSGIQAYSRSPANSTNGNYGHKLGEFNVRVEVCVPGLLEEDRSEEHTSELQSRGHLVCRLLREKKKYCQHIINVCYSSYIY